MAIFKLLKKKANIAPTYMVFVWFGVCVMAGTILLWLPVSHTSSNVRIDFIAAMFTAVSAACVTGLTVVNVADTFSTFGLFIIFILTEMGGMGIMTFASLGFHILHRRLSMSQQVATTDAIYQNDAASEFKKTFSQILEVTLAIQTIGAIAMFLALSPRIWNDNESVLFIIWSAIFHSVSAFCNSGFSIYQDGLQSLKGNIPFLTILVLLVLLGGLGHMVLNELYHLPKYIQRHIRKPHWLSLHTKIVLVITSMVITLGIVGFWILGTGEYGNGLGHAIFEAMCGRTAGFSLVPQSGLPLPSIILILFLMFIGGSPGSCAGGIKTTSLAIWFARIKSNLRHDTNVNLFGYTIAPELVSRARLLMAITMIWNVTGVFILAIAHPEQNLQTLAFEQISAFGTVGLSMDFTPELNNAGRLWIILSMFIGRLGPLSIALWIVPSAKVRINRPIGRIMVG